MRYMQLQVMFNTSFRAILVYNRVWLGQSGRALGMFFFIAINTINIVYCTNSFTAYLNIGLNQEPECKAGLK